MAITTVVFGPNDLDGANTIVSGAAPRVARTGGVGKFFPTETKEYRSNIAVPEDILEAYPAWHNEGPSIAYVGVAYKVGAVEKRWRTMLRFILRAVTIDRSSIVSGVAPAVSSWQWVVGARLIWYAGDPAANDLDAVPITINESDLEIRVGRGLYDLATVPTKEGPFGYPAPTGTEHKDDQLAETYDGAPVFGSVEGTLGWGLWALPTRTEKTLVLSQSAIDALLKTISGDADSYIDFGFIALSGEEAAVGSTNVVNFKREIAAWDPHPPRFEIDFNLPVTLSSAGTIASTESIGSAVVNHGLSESGAIGSFENFGSGVVLSDNSHVDPRPSRKARVAKDLRITRVRRRRTIG